MPTPLWARGDTSDQWADQFQIVTLGSLRIQVGGPGKQPTGLGCSRRNPVNPAAAVRGHVVTKGATPVLSPAEARRLLEAIDTAALAGRRDRALVSVMVYSFARVSAVIGMRRQDYFRQESRGCSGSTRRAASVTTVPAHHRAAEALDDYPRGGRARRGEGGALPERRPRGAPADGPGAVEALVEGVRAGGGAVSGLVRGSASRRSRRCTWPSGSSRATSAGSFSRRCRTRSNPAASASRAGCSRSPTRVASPSNSGQPARPSGWSTPSRPSSAPARIWSVP